MICCNRSVTSSLRALHNLFVSLFLPQTNSDHSSLSSCSQVLIMFLLRFKSALYTSIHISIMYVSDSRILLQLNYQLNLITFVSSNVFYFISITLQTDLNTYIFPNTLQIFFLNCYLRMMRSNYFVFT